jgi:cell wall-associated NlpC family hydrolase
MNKFSFIITGIFIMLLPGCSSSRKSTHTATVEPHEIKSTIIIKNKVAGGSIDVKQVKAEELVSFAKTLLGIPYRYGSVKKENGFDCSGFVNYVFNHFQIKVPRTTAEFTNVGKEVSIKESKVGDLILFTGSNAKTGIVGHMGIIIKNKKNNFTFIHAASGKGGGVIVSEMNAYFIPRFVKVIRVFL